MSTIWTREELLGLIACWKAAYKAASTGKSYTVQGRTLTRYDLPENYMLTATLFPQSGFGQATLRFRESADRTEGYSLTVDFQTGEIGIGSRYRTFQRKCGIDPYAPLKIRLFVDGTIAECFVNDAYCFTMRIYDSLGTGVSFRSTAPGLTVKDLVVRVCE